MVETPEQTQKPVETAKPSTDYSALMRLSGVALVFLAIGLAAGFFLPGLTGYASCPLTENSQDVDQTLLSQNITDYLNENFLEMQGLNVEILDLTDYTNDLYVVDFSIKEGDDVLQSGQLYAAKDGSAIVLGEVLKLDEPLPDVPAADPEPQTFAQSDQPKVELYVMSFCPYGQQAETNLYDVVSLLGDNVDFEPHFIHYDNYCGWGVKCQASAEDLQMGYTEDASAKADYCLDPENDVPEYCAMHGVDELNENLRQMCVLQDYPEKFWSYVARINMDAAEDTDYCALGDEACWQAALAAEGIDLASVEACVAENALDFVASEKALVEQNGVSGSPTIFINGTSYTGARTPEAFKTAICSAFTTMPAACSQELGASGTTATGGCGA